MPQIDTIIAQMTMQEKAALCTGATAWTTTPVERLGVAEMFAADGSHGVRRVPEATLIAIGALPAAPDVVVAGLPQQVIAHAKRNALAIIQGSCHGKTF